MMELTPPYSIFFIISTILLACAEALPTYVAGVDLGVRPIGL